MDGGCDSSLVCFVVVFRSFLGKLRGLNWRTAHVLHMLAGRLNIFGDMNHSHVRQGSIHGICLKQVFWTSMVVVFFVGHCDRIN